MKSKYLKSKKALSLKEIVKKYTEWYENICEKIIFESGFVS